MYGSIEVLIVTALILMHNLSIYFAQFIPPSRPPVMALILSITYSDPLTVVLVKY